MENPYPYLGSSVVPFCPFHLGVSLLKPNIMKNGTLMIKGLLGNLDKGSLFPKSLDPMRQPMACSFDSVSDRAGESASWL